MIYSQGGPGNDEICGKDGNDVLTGGSENHHLSLRRWYRCYY
jgi:Ca2+-binding RTX toxin-like protein